MPTSGTCLTSLRQAVYSGEAAERLLCQLGRMDLAGAWESPFFLFAGDFRLLCVRIYVNVFVVVFGMVLNNGELR